MQLLAESASFNDLLWNPCLITSITVLQLEAGKLGTVVGSHLQPEEARVLFLRLRGQEVPFWGPGHGVQERLSAEPGLFALALCDPRAGKQHMGSRPGAQRCMCCDCPLALAKTGTRTQSPVLWFGVKRDMDV